LIFVGVVILGVFSLNNLAIDMYPKMDIPSVIVMTTYPGANAADIETNVSRILEDNLNTVENLKEITSRSSDNISMVTLELEWGSDMTEAVNDVRDVVGRVEPLLPEEVDEPIVLKISSSMMPVVVLYATANESYPALNKILDEKLVNPLNRVDGVGAVSLMGSPVREIQVNVDPQRIEAYNLSVEQIGQIIAAENVDTPGGTLDIGQQTINIRAMGELGSSDQLRDIVVADYNGRPVYLRDVAQIRDTLEKTTLDERINGRQGVRIIVQKQSGANSVGIANQVTALLPAIQASLPPDVHLGVVVDSSDYIKNSINSLSETVLYAFLFVMLVVLFFLGRWRATFIIILTIPISLITAFIYLMLTDSTLNIISLSSLSIAIGMVVDDAIVVLENITKHMERGSSPREASIYGTNEVWLAVIATTLVIVAVFMPLTMLSGIAGIMFKELGWIVTIVTCVSTVAAVSLTPMLTSIMLKTNRVKSYKGVGKVFIPIEKFLDGLDSWYANMLAWVVRHRTVTLLSALVIFGVSILLFMGTPFDFFPKSDDGQISATVELDQGVSTDYTVRVARQIDSIWREKYPEIDIMSTSAGASSGSTFAAMQNTGSHIISYMMRMVPRDERERTIFEISDGMRADLDGIAEIVDYTVAAGGGGAPGGGSGGDIQVKVFGYDLDETDALAQQLRDQIAEIPGTADVQLSRDEMRPEYRIIFDRAKLATYGLNTATVSAYVRNRINGLTASKYREDGDEYDIIVRYGEEFRESLEAIENITVYSPQGQPVRLREVGEIVEEFAPPTIERENRQRVISVNVTLAGASMSEVAEPIEAIIAQTDIPEDVYVEIGGSYEDLQETLTDMMTLLVLIIILVYIVMATQFESFRSPFIIMFSLPFAFTGVFLALWLTGTSMSIIAMIGAIMLVGIVVKNGIVMVDFTNLLRDRGMSINQSVINAGKSRLRPVLMTSLTTILGMLPLALSSGEGSEIWKPMGIAVIGGLTFSTILTLIVIPVMYSLFGSGRLKRQRKIALQTQQLLDSTDSSDQAGAEMKGEF
jgi:HAE1 family hydrophobic/amphiphilic exporter-1